MSTKNTVVELEITPGLEEIALDELLSRFPDRLTTQPVVDTGAIRFGYAGNLGGLLSLQTIHAAYLLETYDIPRPKAFLGHQHFTRLMHQITRARSLTDWAAFQTITINAAGSSSSVMKRLLESLAKETRLTLNPYEGDMTIRLRRAAHGEGWDALVRLSPRPTATRSWRVVNVPGALNGAVARAMVILSQPDNTQRVLNMACGSGSLAIERILTADAVEMIACDNDLGMVEAALKNIEAAELTDKIEVRAWDATDIPLSPASFDVILADLPFGQRLGSHKENRDLYPAIFKEAARLLAKDGVFVVITHEVRLMEAVLKMVTKWSVREELRITLSGLHPRIYVLRRQ